MLLYNSGVIAVDDMEAKATSGTEFYRGENLFHFLFCHLLNPGNKIPVQK